MTGKRQESGFALLLVFAMASIIAITMYMALPRVAFESERDKEQLLIDRGEQYSRAIQLYVRKTKRFPAKIEDLENTNGIRFLRKQYVDPMTGKGEWRIIHAGPGGVLIDSLVTKQTKKDAPVVDNFITELPTSVTTPTEANTNPALRRRPSEQQTATAGATPTGINAIPTPGAPAAITSTQAQPSTQPGATAGGITNMPMFGSAPQPAPTAQLTPGTPTQNAQQQANQSPLPGQVPAAIQQQLNNPSGQLPGVIPPGGNGPNNAGMLIQNLLTSPRPGGLAGVQGAQQQGQVMGGGIAGIASNYKGSGIKLYHDQDEFPKWEFVYDVAKDVSMNPAAVLPKTAPAPGTPIGQDSTTNTNGMQQQTPPPAQQQLGFPLTPPK